MALAQGGHRASALKQQNKKHNTLGHRTKGQLKAPKGRESLKSITTKNKALKELSREVRRHKAKQIRKSKREEVCNKKRNLGTNESAPFLVTVVPLSKDINPKAALSCLSKCVDSNESSYSKNGILHLCCTRFKQRFSFVLPPASDLYAILDCIKVSDTVLFLWPPGEELDEAHELMLSSILAQGLPTPVHAVLSVEDFGQKDGTLDLQNLESQMDTQLVLQSTSKPSSNSNKKMAIRQRLLKEVESRFPGGVKLYYLDKPQESMLLLRQIGAQKQRPVFYRDHRAHLIAEEVSYEGQGTVGTLKLTGYIRGMDMNPDMLVHLPGWGDFQLSHIDILSDPHQMSKNRLSGDGVMAPSNEPTSVLKPSKNQETLTATNDVDPMEGEQTWPTEDEIREAQQEMMKLKEVKTKTKKVPKGTSEYQAAWILDSDDGSDGEDDDDDEDSDMDDNIAIKSFKPIDVMSQASDDDDEVNDADNEEYETMTMTEVDDNDYDNNIDYSEEMDALEKFRAARDDEMFPDELDTPKDVSAHIRFQKYRGLESFRTSEWDPYENLPVDYAKIFQFKNFQHTRRRILKELADSDVIEAMAGSYVVLHLKDFPRYMYDSMLAPNHGPPVVFSTLPNEQKMSVVNVVLKSHSLGHVRSIKSKERLVYQIGYRRFANSAIFSEHSSGNKHRYFRYFHSGQTVVATMFAPIVFPPVSVLAYRQRPDGSLDLVATGSVLSVDPTRIICKRVILSGHPFKVNKKSCVVRYMFFNREDVEWFKPVELRTKWGRRGHIKEPLGTHGHMKCYVDGQLKSQDTVLMNLYKRMFPKWTYDPHVARPPSLYLIKALSSTDSCDEDTDPQISSKAKKRKKVTFHSS